MSNNVIWKEVFFIATHVYACLCGEWVNLGDDPESRIGGNHSNPYIWWEEGAEVYSPIDKDQEHTMYQQDYVNIYFKGAEYRIHPMFIQIKRS
ncbi:hypothetical protein [Shouchella hunanensis]|uniref:Uncharacterized protein n=1 Tax=Shouchella hunanensis TaxID=766894 RepID=A0ABY7W2L7_9BACI|nr:hypothetical protein [Shouchella hunanensis]WDF02928.1 hypothetical protein PQ477_15690 [Shouchella hunanensis]